MPSISDMIQTRLTVPSPGSFLEKERAFHGVRGSATVPFSHADAIKSSVAPGSLSNADGERAYWLNLCNVVFTLGLPTNLSLSDYKNAGLYAGVPTL